MKRRTPVTLRTILTLKLKLLDDVTLKLKNYWTKFEPIIFSDTGGTCVMMCVPCTIYNRLYWAVVLAFRSSRGWQCVGKRYTIASLHVVKRYTVASLRDVVVGLVMAMCGEALYCHLSSALELYNRLSSGPLLVSRYYAVGAKE